MRTQTLLVALFIALITSFSQQTAGRSSSWEQVATGIEYRKFELSDPANLVYVTRMDRDNPAVTLESSMAKGQLRSGLETVSGMAARYEQTLNYWGTPTLPVNQAWGSRNDVVVAINGFYYDPETGVPRGGQLHSGWYAKRYDSYSGDSGFVWKMDRSAFIGECVYHPENKQYIDFPNGETQNFYGVNVTREPNKLFLYTPQYGRDTGTDDSGLEVLVQMEAPTYPALAQNVPFGTVVGVYTDTGSTPIPFDHVVLSATGPAAATLQNNVQVGARIGIAQKIKDCPAASTTQNWEYTYAGVGGDFYFLKNGIIDQHVVSKDNAKVRDPRTAIAYNDQHIFFIVVDGRLPGVSEGMTIQELAEFAKNQLNASFGIAQDGGGSSTMVINGEQVNIGILCRRVYLPLVFGEGNSTKTEMKPLGQGTSVTLSVVSSTGTCERPVANGMMMVLVESPEFSTAFKSGDYVTTNENTGVYLGPGSDHLLVQSVLPGQDGQIKAHANNLDGVLARGSYWWQVDLNGETGWVQEQFLNKALKQLLNDWRKSVHKTR